MIRCFAVFAWLTRPLFTRWGHFSFSLAALIAMAFYGVDPESALAQKPRVPAPSLEGGIEWLNTAGPIKLEDLKGRIVLLDFWTLCCINCIHTLPDLAKLEAKYPGILVVLGIHTPKFDNEKLTESIRKAILRYEVKHPVVNDADHKIWRRLLNFTTN